MTPPKLPTARTGLLLATLFGVATTLFGLAGPAPADDAMKGMTMPAPSRAESPADRDFAKANAAMMKNMATKPTGDTDRDFVDMMLPHHQGAIDMARVELQYGKDPMLRALAADIVKAQDAEIATMQDWKKRH